MRNRIVAGAAAAAATALVLAGCTSGGTDGGDATDGGRRRAHAGDPPAPVAHPGAVRRLLPRRRNGYWEDLGLDVEIIPGAVDIVPQDVLAAGDVDFAIAWVPKALALDRGRARTSPNIAQIFERSGTLQVAWADSGIDRPADLSGKTGRQLGLRQRVGALRGPHRRRTSTDYTIVQQNFDMNALLNGEIDAAQAMTYNEYAQLLEADEPRDRRALPARGLHGHRLERGRHGDAPGRDLGQHRAARSPTRSTPTPRSSSSRARSSAGSTRATTREAAADAVDRGRLRRSARATSSGWPTRSTS